MSQKARNTASPCRDRIKRATHAQQSMATQLTSSGQLDLEELCDLLTRSWPEAGTTQSTSSDSISDAVSEALHSTSAGDDATNNDATLPALINLPLIPIAHADHSTAVVSYESDNLPIAYPLSDEGSDNDEFESGEEKPKKFSEEAMRVLVTCEELLNEHSRGRLGINDRAKALRDIASLKKRFNRRDNSPTRCIISRRAGRRYSLGSDARRVLKAWVDRNIEDPYPSVAEKNELAQGNGSHPQADQRLVYELVRDTGKRR